jgi:SRSO17 transposase
VAVLARVDDIEAARLASGLDSAFALVAGRFFRREVRVRARACLAGMLSGLERRTGWSLAEHAGESTPDGMQRLFTSAKWDEDLVRDDLRRYVTAALGDPGGVLIGDDTGFEKKGNCSAGVQRQYTGTAGKITGSSTSHGRGPGTRPGWPGRRCRRTGGSGRSRSSCRR